MFGVGSCASMVAPKNLGTNPSSCLTSNSSTSKNVAGIDVPPFLLWFSDFASSTSWLCSSSVFPFFLATSKAFIVGPQ